MLSHLSTSYQQENFQSLLASLLGNQDKTLAANPWKSASALSRFLGVNRWSLGPLIVMVRAYLLTQLLQSHGRGRRPYLEVMVDLTSLEKVGKFKQFRHWMHFHHKCYGLHVVVLYLCCGRQRVPWSLAIYRGKGKTSPAQLGLRLIRELPDALHQFYDLQVLADGGFSSREFLVGLKRLRIPALVGCAGTRRLVDGRNLKQLARRGQQVQLHNLPFPVWVSWFWQKQPDGRYRQRFVLSTRPLSAASMNRWGAKRWRIEALFKTMKQRFGARRFGLRRLRAVLRWLFFGWLAYLLAHRMATVNGQTERPDWEAMAVEAAETFFTGLMLDWHRQSIQQLQARTHTPEHFDLSFRGSS
ncbi:MAG: transposase [Cyanobacteria bacterium P01_F01_bin.116]